MTQDIKMPQKSVMLSAAFPMRLNLFPCFRAEEDQHGQNFQSAEDHAKAEQELGESTVTAVVCIGTDRLKAGADIGYAGERSRKITEKSMLHSIHTRIGKDGDECFVDGVEG